MYTTVVIIFFFCSTTHTHIHETLWFRKKKTIARRKFGGFFLGFYKTPNKDVNGNTYSHTHTHTPHTMAETMCFIMKTPWPENLACPTAAMCVLLQYIYI